MERNFFKTIDVRELGEVDVLPVIKILVQLKNEWDTKDTYESNHNKKASLSQVSHVNFRWSDKSQDRVRYVDLPLWDTFKQYLLPIMQKAVVPFGYKNGYFPRVMLAYMQPGTYIPEHIDGNNRGWIPHKIHVPIVTNPNVKFYVNGKEYHFEKGKVYEVNNAAPHAVKNEGDSARIHLIFEYLDADINDVPCIDVKQEATVLFS
jgi:hypothetical protein